jgi:hypothetical protein
MQRQPIGRIAGIILALLIASLAAVALWAQGNDTPIVILDGSLTMESAVPWSQFKGTGDLRTHPVTTKSVTQVLVSIAGTDQTVKFDNEQCVVDVTYAGTDIKVSTGPNGKGLRITPFGAFRQGDSPNRLAHKDQSAKISHVTISRAGVVVFDAPASGGTKVTISYK